MAADYLTPVPFKKRRKRESTIRLIFRTNLRNRRLRLGMTAKQLAERLGVAAQWIHALENRKGQAVPGLAFLEQLACELGCTPADLLTPNKYRGVVSSDEDLRGKLRG